MDTNRDYFPSERDETPEVRRAYPLGGLLMDTNRDYFPSDFIGGRGRNRTYNLSIL